MSKTRIAINGLGRIGRTTFRILLDRTDVEIVALNDLTDVSSIAQLLKYDSVYRRLGKELTVEGNTIHVDGQSIAYSSERTPEALPWAALNVDVVVDCTGLFKTYEKAEGHLKAGAKKVVLSYPVGDDAITSIVLGVNDDLLENNPKIVSNASCTTNCSAPLIKVLENNFGIKRGYLNTIHAYTADQRINDSFHSDPRRGRAAAVNIVPTSTGAAKALGLIFPELKGKITGGSYRVPVITGSCVDMILELEKDATAEEINAAMKAASETDLKGVLEYNTDPLVSSDIVASPFSSIFDSELTSVDNGLVKVVSWYDNEYGYSNRLAELAARV
ncbi:MAG: type I glyceraldehyde-3-phosphate dehydrogenase [Salibacteraceae bacterium]|jgi:glyceraldehyde 3-phosphate dehydrogenase|nr:type I glyceraldehyde-3-phosphate dehydrogenase [Salibacteraceae bacterium]